MSTWQVDVGWSFADHTDRRINPGGDDWRRVVVSAQTATDAQLVACQMVARHGMPVWSMIVDWED
jgi:hypothetical protein